MQEIFKKIDVIKPLIHLNLNSNSSKQSNLKKINFSHRYNHNYNYNYNIIRQSMINLDSILKDNFFSEKLNIIESDSGNEEETSESSNIKIPSLKTVKKNIFDPNTIMLIKDSKYFPKEAKPGLLIVNIEKWVTEKYLKYFLEDIPPFQELTKEQISKFIPSVFIFDYLKFFIDENGRYCVFVNIYSIDQLDIIIKYFNNPIKNKYPTLNSKNEKMEFYYAYNILEVTKSFWYGVIIRNLPKECDYKNIFEFFKKYIQEGIKYCLNSININENNCALIVCKDLNFAEKLCQIMNNFKIKKDKILMVHFHPNICKIRINLKNNGDNFFAESYEYEEIINNGEICINNSVSCMEVLFPKLFNYFNLEKKYTKIFESNKNSDKNSKMNNFNKKEIEYYNYNLRSQEYYENYENIQKKKDKDNISKNSNHKHHESYSYHRHKKSSFNYEKHSKDKYNNSDKKISPKIYSKRKDNYSKKLNHSYTKKNYKEKYKSDNSNNNNLKLDEKIKKYKVTLNNGEKYSIISEKENYSRQKSSNHDNRKIKKPRHRHQYNDSSRKNLNDEWSDKNNKYHGHKRKRNEREKESEQENKNQQNMNKK